jgi:hypothetical protein
VWCADNSKCGGIALLLPAGAILAAAVFVVWQLVRFKAADSSTASSHTSDELKTVAHMGTLLAYFYRACPSHH